jgi:hypothetical protein
MALGWGGSRKGKSSTSPRPRDFIRRMTPASPVRLISGSVKADRVVKLASS